MEEQRLRLEHFLSVATQVRAMRDVAKVRELLRELHETGKSLPLSRMNELRNLQVMTSPYNQTLLAMLRMENAQVKSLREHTKLLERSDLTTPKDQQCTNDVTMSRVTSDEILK